MRSGARALRRFLYPTLSIPRACGMRCASSAVSGGREGREGREGMDFSEGFGGSYLHGAGGLPLQYATTGAVLGSAAARWPGRVALRSPFEGIDLTYEQLLIQADGLARALSERGVGRGDRLGIWSHNSAAWVLALVACLREGIIPVAINPLYEKPELEFCLKKTGVKALLLGEGAYYGTLCGLVPEMASAPPAPSHLRAAALPDLTTVIVAGRDPLPGTFTLESLVAEGQAAGSASGAAPGLHVGPDDGCIIHFTSGTTGEPKAALDSHFAVVNQTYYVGRRNTLHEAHHTVCVQVPIFHALGSVITVLGALRHGATLLLAAPAYSAAASARAILEHKCSVVVGTPTMFVDLVAKLRASGATPPALRVALTAGAPCSPQLFRDIHQYLAVDSVKSLYGMTEATASVFMSLPGESEAHVTDTVGALQDHVEVKVVDEQERLVPWGSPGQLLVRGYNVMLGYWDEPARTRQALSADGWLRTGDRFSLSKDGYGRIVGREKDIIVRGGENIAPKEIEDLLNSHPGVLEAQVVGVSDARLGEEVCAVVRPAPGARPSLEQLRAHCEGRLARYKLPRLLRLVDEFPKTASGKIQKYKLREMIDRGDL